ncbi:hypothetical protein PlfCFBP13513_06725 [Plantibacter flavus]|uniref:hypothetical protein n=1 Tax=Plantibacter TaxID=190323 RepID=UPI0007D9DBD8|nr:MULTISPECIES: hypothetical protein [Plantibacter]MBD8101885.1 hypothetical protein [Plantibacter sp. CFBP 8775]MBD8536887.1 hypothetical protein [Plantibacter sp. CFBP 13570]OAN35391.1 hypothetical protein A4X17_10660 [Plantibacter sp. H53]OII43161.1 hypothetical protein BIU99_15000 [Plantibacter sp. MMLR14_011]TKJ99094.1 hypothetical protein PlfCFBP13513_06725 [Plantibacter flavus]
MTNGQLRFFLAFVSALFAAYVVVGGLLDPLGLQSGQLAIAFSMAVMIIAASLPSKPGDSAK